MHGCEKSDQLQGCSSSSASSRASSVMVYTLYHLYHPTDLFFLSEKVLPENLLVSHLLRESDAAPVTPHCVLRQKGKELRLFLARRRCFLRR